MKIKISKGAEFVLKRLESHNEEGYIVGGCVRDFLLNIEPSDFDVTTSASPSKIEEIFSDCKLITLGKEFGTIGVLIDGEVIETTTFRKDGDYLDGRHPEKVEFSTNLKEDLMRRDFTINSMAMDIRGKLFDYFGGKDDLLKGIIKTVGDPLERFTEDKLRILRGVRFSNRFDFKIEENTFKAMKNMASKIKEVSKERIQEELNKILLSDTPKRGVEILLETKLLENIFPELMPTVGYDQMSPYHHKDLFKHTLCVVESVDKKIHLKYAALFHDVSKVDTLSIDEDGVGHFYGHDELGGKVCEEALKRLKYDNKTIKNAKLLIQKHMKVPKEIGKKGQKRLLNALGEELIFDLINLCIGDLLCTRDDRDPTYLYEIRNSIKEIINSKVAINKEGLALNGNDLMEIGYKQGIKLGNTLDYLTELVIDDESLNNKDTLLKIAKKKLTEDI